MNITYLIGAGASYNALPILSELPDRLQYLIYELEGQIRNFDTEDRHRVQGLVKDLNWIIGETRNHQTIDTFARKLFLNSRFHDDLRRFKALLTIYFLFEQSFPYASKVRKHVDDIGQPTKQTEGFVDKRYDSFIASIISNDIDTYKLNSSVKILSWNYDSQFELAYQKFNGTDLSIELAQQHIQLIPSRSRGIKVDLNEFGVIKLNGTATFYHEEQQFYDWIGPVNDYIGYYTKLISTYEEALKRDDLIGIRYAWESDHEKNNPFYQTVESEMLKSNALSIAKQTDILVVIGYSFPIFNRQVDKTIIESMQQLKKVYIQDVNPDRIATIMQSSFANLARTTLSPEEIAFHKTNSLRHFNEVPFFKDDSLNNFLLPPELN